ncbi:Putative cytochrome P450 128 [Frankliniella fusca]|uniref:Gustatory receptor n=1 Tax=Frankliniella fusca TaxID=407009 RepID=A0AAE1LJP5_9NEOP|nr:Putative cytochrome P450 128 [Frankliniella fusca]
MVFGIKLHQAQPRAPGGWALQWRAMLSLMSLMGLNCAGGWPPRFCRALRCYGALTALVRTWCVYGTVWGMTLNMTQQDEGRRYGLMLCVYEMAIKGVAAIVTQGVLLLRGRHLCRLTESLLMYARVGAPSAGWGATPAVAPSFWLLTMFMAAWSVCSTSGKASGVVEALTCLLGDLMPTMAILNFNIWQLLLLSIFVGFAIDEGRHVREWLSAMMGEQPLEGWMETSLDKSPDEFLDRSLDRSQPPRARAAQLAKQDLLLLRLRELRGRQQLLHDLVVQNNWAFGLGHLCVLLHVFIESVLCLYEGIACLRRQASSVVPEATSPWEDADLVLWAFYEISMFAALCVLGQRLSDKHSQVYWDLQGYIVTNPQVCSETIMAELQSFAQQIQMQDNRPGVFDLLFFDSSLLNAVLKNKKSCCWSSDVYNRPVPIRASGIEEAYRHETSLKRVYLPD